MHLFAKTVRACYEVEHQERLKGRVVEVKENAVAAKVKVDIGGGNIITSAITVDAVRDLALNESDEVCALIKASSVIIMKEYNSLNGEVLIIMRRPVAEDGSD